MAIPHNAIEFHFDTQIADYYKEIQNKICDNKKLSYNEACLLFAINEYFEAIQSNLRLIPQIGERIHGERCMRKEKTYRRTSEL